MKSTINFPVWATGRRKTSIARVRVIQGSGQLLINDKSIKDYFSGHIRASADATAPLHVSQSATSYDFHVSVIGGGVAGQAGAVKLGLARALVQIDPSHRTSF